MDIIAVKKLILRKLIRSNIWGGKHTPISFVISGIPEIYRRNAKGKKIIEKAVKELIVDEWILIFLKKTGKGSEQHISLNPRKISEINEFIEMPDF